MVKLNNKNKKLNINICLSYKGRRIVFDERFRNKNDEFYGGRR